MTSMSLCKEGSEQWIFRFGNTTSSALQDHFSTKKARNDTKTKSELLAFLKQGTAKMSKT
jgi:hypothetical protein